MCIELTAQNYKMLYVLAQLAHRCGTLENKTKMIYFMWEFYTLGVERSLRWNDPQFNVHWPEADRTMSEKDQKIEDFDPEENSLESDILNSHGQNQIKGID